MMLVTKGDLPAALDMMYMIDMINMINLINMIGVLRPNARCAGGIGVIGVINLNENLIIAFGPAVQSLPRNVLALLLGTNNQPSGD